MTPKQFRKFTERDKRCYHCGATEDLIPHHRSNRGMGGARSADKPSNIISMCAIINGLMESDSAVAEAAREFGWKLSRYENALIKPVYDASTGFWFRLDDNYKRAAI